MDRAWGVLGGACPALRRPAPPHPAPPTPPHPAPPPPSRPQERFYFGDTVLPLFESGALRPVIDSTYSLDQVAAAHEYVATNANVGKVLLTLR